MKTVLMLLAALAVPIAANAEAVTYDFTGVVANGTTFPGISIGSTVTGTYTFDYSYTNPAQSTGTVGSSAGWQAVAETTQGSLSPQVCRLPQPHRLGQLRIALR